MQKTDINNSYHPAQANDLTNVNTEPIFRQTQTSATNQDKEFKQQKSVLIAAPPPRSLATQHRESSTASLDLTVNPHRRPDQANPQPQQLELDPPRQARRQAVLATLQRDQVHKCHEDAVYARRHDGIDGQLVLDDADW